MKRLFRTIKQSGLLLLPAFFAGAFVAMPAGVGAIAGADNSSQSQFCANLPASADKITASVTSLKDKLATARQDQISTITTRRQKEDSEIQANRSKWDAQRQENFTKLEAKATTDSQKTAVLSYQSSLRDSISVRRLAYDAARTAYRSGVDNAISSKRTAIDSQANAFTSSINSAVAAARASCAANAEAANGPATRARFVADLKAARQTFETNRKDDAKLGNTVRQLAQTRNSAFRAANAAFESSAKTARETLKAAFGPGASDIQ